MTYHQCRRLELLGARKRKPKWNARWVQEAAAAAQRARELREAAMSALNRLESHWRGYA